MRSSYLIGPHMCVEVTSIMQIRYGFEIEIEVPVQTSLITAFDVHPDRRNDIIEETPLWVTEPNTAEIYYDLFGNLCRRILAPAGLVRMQSEGVVSDSGNPDKLPPDAPDLPMNVVPSGALPFLLASRYCETDLLGDFAWANFGNIQGGWAKVRAICNFVHNHLTFSYPMARPTRTAHDAYQERLGVCRDFAHLAITLCRCLNIPARYCNGYLGDIGVPPDIAAMDFNAWFEAYLNDGNGGGRWYTFDARHNMPRIGRILLARGRDATDIPMLFTFGPHRLNRFIVITEEA